MRIAPLFDNVYVGAGEVMVEPYDANGVATGLRHVGNADNFSLNFAADVIEMFSSMSHTKGRYGELPRRVNPTFRINSKEFIEETVRMQLMADRSRVVQPATAVAAEPALTAVEAGVEAYFRTKVLGPISAVTLDFNGTPGVPGTDYVVVNADVGLIRILPTTILTGPVTVSYTPTAYTATTGPSILTLGTAPLIKARLLFVGDPLIGAPRIIDIPMVSIRPDGAHDLIQDDFGNVVLAGAVYEDRINNPNAPFGVDIWYGDAL